MAKVVLKLVYLNPQPVLVSAGTPQALDASGIETLYVHIQAPSANAGSMYIADTDANIAAGNHTSLGPGESMQVGTEDTAGDEDKVCLLLSSLRFDGSNTGDKLVVSYLDFQSIDYAK